MSSISPIPSARTALAQNTTATARAAQPADQTGFAARVAELGPMAGTIVATSDLLDTAAKATYTIATKKLGQFGDAVENAATKTADTLQDWGHAIEHGAESAVHTVEDAAQSLAKAFENGTQRVGQWLDEAV